MKSIKIKCEGLSPVLLHNNQTADPLNVYKKALDSLTSKRKKTDADHLLISRIEWEAGLYIDRESGRIGFPGENLERMLLDAAKKNKNGPKIKSGVQVDDNFIPIDFGENGFRMKNFPEKPEQIPTKELNKIFERNFDRRPAKIARNTVIRTRPRFDKWSIEFTILFDPDIIDDRTIRETIKVAEMQIGIGDYRPGSPGGGRYGRFTSSIIG